MASTRILSGIQPTGLMHIGNYFGAIRNWVDLQAPGVECFYCAVDYHSITMKHEPKELRARSLELVLDLLACGVDPEKSALFLQSQVPEHTELAWILASVTSYGDLERMTQFKDKSTDKEFVSAGLFTYPILMAADILLYKATHVPVGQDQLQHLEQTSDIGKRFNHWFGDTFPEPKPVMTRAPKIQSLADPTKKMSKSLGDKHYVGVFEPEASARAKIKSAVTATGGDDKTAPGVANLFLLLEQSNPPANVLSPLRDAQQAGNLKYSDLKQAVADSLMAMLAPMRDKRASLTEKVAREVLAAGGERARKIARATIAEARDKIGLYEVR